MDAFSDFGGKPASSQIFSFLISFPSSTPRARDFDEFSRAAACPYDLQLLFFDFHSAFRNLEAILFPPSVL